MDHYAMPLDIYFQCELFKCFFLKKLIYKTVKIFYVFVCFLAKYQLKFLNRAPIPKAVEGRTEASMTVTRMWLDDKGDMWS